MQGRLSPAPSGRPQAFPWSTWADEFACAAALGFDVVEWLVTAERPYDNPLLSRSHHAAIGRVAQRCGVMVSSVCADCFISLPLVGPTGALQRERVDMLDAIVRQAARIGAGVVVLPLLEANAPADDHEALAIFGAISPVLRSAAAEGVRVGLEIGWPGERIAKLIASCEAPALGVCYDLGNAAAFGLDTVADLRALGVLVCAVHVKDRRRSGESVPLGEGDADLAAGFRTLDQIGYSAAAILETPVGNVARASASRNLALARGLIAQGAMS